jgi:hypothetical protein
MTHKEHKKSFHELVGEKSLGHDKMTTEQVWAFSKRARSYICAYYALRMSSKEGN